MARVFFTVLVTAVCALTLLPASASAVRGGERMDRLEKLMIAVVNVERGRHGLPRLKPSRALARSADLHSWDMLRRDFFAHTSPNGATVNARVARYTRRNRLGETLGYESGHSTRGLAGRIVRAWLRSPGHRAVLLDRSYSRIGLARRAGFFGRARATVVTANLSSRR